MPYILNPLSGTFDFYQASSSSSGGLTTAQQVQGLAFDFDPANGVTKDGSNNVSAVIDQGPFGYTLSQSTGANQPLYVASGTSTGKPIIRFGASGATHYINGDLSYPALVPTSSSTGLGWTIYLIFKFNGFSGSPAYQCPIFFTTATSGTIQRAWMLLSNDSSSAYSDVSFGAGGGSPLAITRSGNIGLGTTGFHVLRLTYDGLGNTNSNFTYSLDSTVGTTGANGGYSSVTTGPVCIGARGNDQAFPLSADIARILVFGNAVSAANHSKLMSYFRTTYGTP